MGFQSSKLNLLAKPFNWNGKRIGDCCNNKNKASKDQGNYEILMPMQGKSDCNRNHCLHEY